MLNERAPLVSDNRTHSFFNSLPIYGDALLPDRPDQLIHNLLKGKKVLIGNDNFERNLMALVERTLKKRGSFSHFYDQLMKSHDMKIWIRNLYRLMRSEVPTLSTTELERIMYQYFSPRGNQTTWRQSLPDFYVDYNIVCPIILQVRQMTTANDIYSFVYTYSEEGDTKSKDGANESKEDGAIKLVSDTGRAGHSSHLPFMFGLPLQSPSKHEKSDIDASKEMISFVSKFVTSKNDHLISYN